ncbi:hypothetical protein ACJX0J_022357, partial [Zea mays]
MKGTRANASVHMLPYGIQPQGGVSIFIYIYIYVCVLSQVTSAIHLIAFLLILDPA